MRSVFTNAVIAGGMCGVSQYYHRYTHHSLENVAVDIDVCGDHVLAHMHGARKRSALTNSTASNVAPVGERSPGVRFPARSSDKL